MADTNDTQGDGIAPDPITITGKEQWTTDEVVVKKPYKVSHVDTNDELDDLIDKYSSMVIEEGGFFTGSLYSIEERVSERIVIINKTNLAKLIQSDREKAVRNVDRFEVIDDTGRAYVKGSIYGSPVKIELDYQDNGRTLKVFVEARLNKEE